MKKIFCLLLLTVTFQLAAQEEGKGTIELKITNIDNDEGQMLIALYDAKDNWLKKYYKGTFAKIENGTSSVSFTGIPDGTYAISCFHDEDNDGELDSFLGIPSEDTGASNNAPARMGPPKWEDAKFELQGKSIKHSIKL